MTGIIAINVHARLLPEPSNKYKRVDPARFYSLIDNRGNVKILFSQDGTVIYEMTTHEKKTSPVFGDCTVKFEEPLSGRSGEMFLGPIGSGLFPDKQVGDIGFGSRIYRQTGESLHEIETSDWPTERVPMHLFRAPDGRLVYVSNFAAGYRSIRAFIGEGDTLLPVMDASVRPNGGGELFVDRIDSKSRFHLAIRGEGRPRAMYFGNSLLTAAAYLNDNLPLTRLDPSDYTITETRDAVTIHRK